jgi:hypothetical protein
VTARFGGAEGFGSLSPEIVTALELLGSMEVHELSVRFVIEAPKLRTAVDLAAALRQIDRAAVRVRPAPLNVRKRRWTITMTLAGLRFTLMILEGLERRVRDTVASYEGCRVVAWHPLVDVYG